VAYTEVAGILHRRAMWKSLVSCCFILVKTHLCFIFVHYRTCTKCSLYTVF